MPRNGRIVGIEATRIVRALRLVLAAGALVSFAGAASARDPGRPLSTFPPRPLAADEILRVPAPLFPGDDVRVSLLPDQALAEVIIDVNPLNPDNIAICGYARSLKTMSTFHSFDAGKTWTHVSVGDEHDGLGPDFDRFDPTLVFDARGFLYVGYGVRVLVPGGTIDHLVVCRSVDGGRTFGPAATVWIAPDVLGIAGNDKFHLATGPARFDPSVEVVMMAWTWNVPPPIGRVDQQIVFSRSVDAGLTFSPPVVVNDDSISDRGFSLFADPGIGPDGVMYVAWNDINANEIKVDHSFDNGSTWGIDVVVERATIPFRMRIPPQPNRGVFAGPVLDVDCSESAHRGRVYIVYCHGPMEDTDILVRYSDDSANSWSEPVRVNDDPPGEFQFLPWLDVNQTSGRVNVVFYDTREDTASHRSRVHLAASDTGGESFLANVPVADVPSNNGVSNPSRYPGNFLEYIGVAGWGDNAFVAWTDTRNAPSPLTDYYFDRVPDNPTPPVISVTLDPAVLWPPNHKFTKINVVVTVSDDDDPAASFILESVTHDEIGGGSDDDIKGAAFGTADVAFDLRAERNGKGRARVYSVVYRAEDDRGNVARDTAFVVVPHDMGGKHAVAERGPVATTAILAISPNPARGAAAVHYETAFAGRARVSIVDVRGRRVAVLADGVRAAGRHVARWEGMGADGITVASGIYFAVVEAGGIRVTRKIVLVR